MSGRRFSKYTAQSSGEAAKAHRCRSMPPVRSAYPFPILSITTKYRRNIDTFTVEAIKNILTSAERWLSPAQAGWPGNGTFSHAARKRIPHAGSSHGAARGPWIKIFLSFHCGQRRYTMGRVYLWKRRSVFQLYLWKTLRGTGRSVSPGLLRNPGITGRKARRRASYGP